MSETINYDGSKIVAGVFSGNISGITDIPLPTSNVQTFQGPGTPVATGGPFTWVKPIGGNMILIECWGGGGSGGLGGGGGGGGYTSNIFPISIFPGPAVVNVGAGGQSTPGTESNVFTSPGVKIIAGPYGAGGSPAAATGGGGGGVAGPGGPGVTAGAQGGGTGAPSPTINGTIFGGGGGGSGGVVGGTSVYGGGGGGGGPAGTTGGTSVFGGPGGPTTSPRSGVIPGGGGGGPGGIGASGQVRITVF
jgi:hypothetical protein